MGVTTVFRWPLNGFGLLWNWWLRRVFCLLLVSLPYDVSWIWYTYHAFCNISILLSISLQSQVKSASSFIFKSWIFLSISFKFCKISVFFSFNYFFWPRTGLEKKNRDQTGATHKNYVFWNTPDMCD